MTQRVILGADEINDIRVMYANDEQHSTLCHFIGSYVDAGLSLDAIATYLQTTQAAMLKKLNIKKCKQNHVIIGSNIKFSGGYIVCRMCTRRTRRAAYRRAKVNAKKCLF